MRQFAHSRSRMPTTNGPTRESRGHGAWTLARADHACASLGSLLAPARLRLGRAIASSHGAVLPDETAGPFIQRPSSSSTRATSHLREPGAHV